MNFLTRLHRFIPRLSRSSHPAMSFQAAVAKLGTPVKELVIAVTENGVRRIGESANDQAEVTDWIEKATKTVVGEASLQVCGIGTCAKDSLADEVVLSRASTLCLLPEPTLLVII